MSETPATPAPAPQEENRPAARKVRRPWMTWIKLFLLCIIVICLNGWVVIIICVHKIVLLTLVFVLYHSAQIDVINALENIVFDVGVGGTELCYKLLHFLPL